MRAFAQEPRHLKQFAELNEENRAANMKTVYLNAAYFPAVELLSALVTRRRSCSTAATRRSTAT